MSLAVLPQRNKMPVGPQTRRAKLSLLSFIRQAILNMPQRNPWTKVTSAICHYRCHLYFCILARTCPTFGWSEKKRTSRHHPCCEHRGRCVLSVTSESHHSRLAACPTMSHPSKSSSSSGSLPFSFIHKVRIVVGSNQHAYDTVNGSRYFNHLIVNGHSRILNWRYLPYIRPM